MNLPRRDIRNGRGLSGLGLLLVAAGLLGLAVAYSGLAPLVQRLWPLVLVAIGIFGLIWRPAWVGELEVRFGPRLSRTADRPRRLLSVVLAGSGLFFLPFTLGLLEWRIMVPALLIALGLLLIWQRINAGRFRVRR